MEKLEGIDLLHKYGLNPVRPEVMDSSALKDFVDCPSLFYLRHILGLKLKSRDPQDDAKFDYGTVWHRVMEAWCNTGDLTEALKQLDPWPRSIMAETDRHGRSKQRMAQQFFEYAERFKEQDDLDYIDLRAEQYFDVYDEELDLRWCGIIDRVRQRRRNKKIVIWDYKTTSAMGANFFEMHEFGFQLPGYVWASQFFLTDPAEEVMMDVLYTLKGSHQFFRRTFRYDRAKLGEWKNNIKLTLDELNRLLDNHLHNPEAWRKNWNQCTRYGLCQFSRVHFMPPIRDSRLLILQNDYVEERWEPSKRGEEGS